MNSLSSYSVLSLSNLGRILCEKKLPRKLSKLDVLVKKFYTIGYVFLVKTYHFVCFLIFIQVPESYAQDIVSEINEDSTELLTTDCGSDLS